MRTQQKVLLIGIVTPISYEQAETLKHELGKDFPDHVIRVIGGCSSIQELTVTRSDERSDGPYL